MPPYRQTSFAAGELAPELWGQTDSPQYQKGARTLRNFIPTRLGAALSRPGMRFCGEVKDSTKTVRLIPFIYSSTDTVQNYVLEFGPSYIRFWNNGALVSSEAGIVEVATTYTEAELPYIRFAQSGDVLTLCHPAHAPAELSRTSNTEWALADVDFSRPVATSTPLLCQTLVGAAPTSATVPPREWAWCVTDILEDTRGVRYESAPRVLTSAIDVKEYDSSHTYAVGDYATYEGHLYRSLQAANTGNPVSNATWWAKDDTGSALSGSFTARGKVTVAPDCPVNILLMANPNTDLNWIGQRLYRGRGNVFGHIGDANGGVFTDAGDTPDYAVQPPQGKNPFVVFYPQTATAVTEHPSAVAFFEDRRVFARTDNRPAFVFASVVGDYANFDSRLVPVADEALKLELASRQREEIRSIVGAEMLVCFTNAGVWAVGGDGASPLSFDNIDAKLHSTVGASWLTPLHLDRTLLYVQSVGAGVRSLTYGVQRELYRLGYVSEDVSAVAQHLVRGHAVKDWAFAQFPWSVAWLVRDDGALLSFTHDRELGVGAWAHHDTDGVVENVCAIPEDSEDVVYLVVRRTIGGVAKRYVERLATRVVSSVVDAICLDAAVTYSGAAKTAISGLDHLEGKSVYALADGNVAGPFTVSGGSITLNQPASTVQAGLAYICEIETLDVPDKYHQKTAVQLAFDVDSARGLLVGSDLSHLVEWQQRTVADSYNALSLANTTVRTPVLGTWDSTVRAALRQPYPLPVTVLGLTLEVDIGG